MASPIAAPSSLETPQQSTPSVDNKEEKVSESSEERALHSSKARFWVNAIIISTYIAALVLAAIHHGFLATLSGHNYLDYSLEERAWVGRASNLISKLVATSLSVVVATTLIQGVRISLSCRSHF
jgi:hypothetical protein